MVEEQNIYAQHDNKGMTCDPRCRPKVHYKTVDEQSHLCSTTVGKSSSSYTPSNYDLQMPILKHTANIQHVPTRALAFQASPKQARPTSTEQHWISPDHYFRPIPHVPEGVDPSPFPNLLLQNLAGEQISRPDTRTPSASNLHLGFDDRKYNHGFEIGSRTHRGLLAYGQVRSSAPHESPPGQPQSRWSQARNYRVKVYEPPYLDPHTDDSIAHVETNAELWVEQLMLSMTNIKDVKDPANSHHCRLFSSESIDPLLIEACSREIFTALMDRCKNGFRGPPAFNKALNANHRLEPDRTATCEERIRNVVQVLSWNKRACKDVLYEDWKIKLLVNHPLSYDKEKDSQKGSNDQRRKRQLAAQEKMEKTEEELRAYREAHREGTGDSTSSAQYNDGYFAWDKTGPQWLLHEADRSLRPEEFSSTTCKRPYEETGGDDIKRQRV
ncbi:uncharacterized protein CC84DRAFT_460696 [Paraphaeosphaeria sporulosa]|uniref:Uncharacterized protein n=1 Tax=Paraphaeosphaeria sporulosa TaxID=1460663 RepID=A0A177CTE0_9PLEO|nr:uncharacterized protein CC84DRAFT_460696 [Paraphaeosphaeria sporulosa]OAG10047.1 hypothetical protein CC84DRAFT_460696 [Paraphaeosphaeria sporulosa]